MNKENIKSEQIFLRVRDVAAILGISIPTVHRLRKSRELPDPRIITNGRIGWLRSEIEQWIKERPKA